MANGKTNTNKAIVQSGKYNPSVLSGGDSISFDNQISWIKFGPFVLLSHAFWSVSIKNPTSSNLELQLPFTSNKARVIGSFGYNNSGKNYIPVVLNPNKLAFSIKNENGSVTDVKGTDFTNFTGQWSLVYTTDEYGVGGGNFKVTSQRFTARCAA